MSFVAIFACCSRDGSGLVIYVEQSDDRVEDVEALDTTPKDADVRDVADTEADVDAGTQQIPPDWLEDFDRYESIEQFRENAPDFYRNTDRNPIPGRIDSTGGRQGTTALNYDFSDATERTEPGRCFDERFIPLVIGASPPTQNQTGQFWLSFWFKTSANFHNRRPNVGIAGIEKQGRPFQSGEMLSFQNLGEGRLLKVTPSRKFEQLIHWRLPAPADVNNISEGGRIVGQSSNAVGTVESKHWQCRGSPGLYSVLNLQMEGLLDRECRRPDAETANVIPGLRLLANPSSQAGEVRYPANDGSGCVVKTKTIESPRLEIFDGKWHRITLGYQNATVSENGEAFIRLSIDGDRIFEYETGSLKQTVGRFDFADTPGAPPEQMDVWLDNIAIWTEPPTWSDVEYE